jgi:hypothetical protein
MPFPVVILGWRAFRFEGNYVVCHETLRRLLPLGLPTEGEGSASEAELLENVGARLEDSNPRPTDNKFQVTD